MKILKIAAVLLLVSAMAIIAYVGSTPYRMRKSIESQIAAIRAKGDPVCWKDLAVEVPDRENGALVYEKVFAVIEPGKAEIAEKCRTVTPIEVLPSLQSVAAKYRHVLPMVEEAASRPQCRFPINWNDPPERAEFPQYGKMRTLAQLLTAVAVADAADGKTDEAVKSIELGYRTSDSLKRQPSTLGCLVQCALIAITSSGLKRSMQEMEISESQARRLFDFIGKIDPRPNYEYAIKAERAQGLDILDRVRKNEPILENSSDRPSAQENKPNATLTRTGGIRADGDELYYLKHMNRIVKAAEPPYYPPTLGEMKTDLQRNFYAIMSAILLPVNSKSKMRAYEELTILSGDRVFLSVLAYKAKFGSYPESLKDVETKLGWKLPQDPLAEKPFHYRREGSGFIVYGVGGNMKDDNGKVMLDKRSSSTPYPYPTGNGYSADMIWEKDF